MIWSWDNAQWLYSLALALPLVLLIDRFFGEPPASVHPVVWMGHLLAWIGERVPRSPASRAFIAGTLGWWLGALLSALLGIVLHIALFYVCMRVGSIMLTALLLAFLLKPLLSLRLLIDEGLAVEAALQQSLHAGRQQTARICSRDTGSLDATVLRETTVESLAENFSDSVVAPLFWFAIAGLPGATWYRWSNTADAMWGYRDVEHEWFGKFAALSDDVINWLPARLSAMALWPADHVQQLLREAGRTPSPNGGWPMAATALKLGVRLSKPGVYVLNADGRPVDKDDIARTASLIQQAGWYTVLALAFLLVGGAMVAADLA